MRCDGEYRVVIPSNYSKATGDYLDEATRRYTFSERGGFITQGSMPLFDLRTPQPEIHLYKVRLDSATPVQSMVKYLEVCNVLRHADESRDEYLALVADNALEVTVGKKGAKERQVKVTVNGIEIEVSCVFFNEAVSFVPCFKYADSADVIFFCSPNIHYLVDQGGQFCPDY